MRRVSYDDDMIRRLPSLTIELDRAKEESVLQAVQLGQKTYRHIDGLILNAGIIEPMGSVGADIPLDAWRTNFEVNFFSLVSSIRAALPSLRESELGGRIIYVSSGAAVKGTPGWGPYSASKAAMNSLCRSAPDLDVSFPRLNFSQDHG